MADFVAVIRKAVDGLANNTPENRAKVYDKARSAVVRQLENMKPRPPEELLRRQILKLDTAIAEVEGEYAEALPATEEEQDDIAPAAADVSSPYYEESVAQEQRYAEEPDTVEPVRLEPEHHAEPEPAHHAYEEEPREEERYAEPEPVEEPAYRAAEVAPEPEAYREPEAYHAEEIEPEPYKPAEVHRDEAPSYFTTNTEEVHYAPVQHEPVAEEDHAHRDWVGQDNQGEEPWQKADDAAVEHYEEAPHHEEQPVAHERDDEVLHENEPLPYAAGYNGQANYYGEVHVEPEHPQAPEEHRYAAEPVAFEDERQQHEEPVAQDKPKQAVVEDFSSYFQDTALDLPSKTSPALPRADEDPFAVDSAKKDDKERTPWDDLEDLIGYDGGVNDRGDKASNSNFDSGFVSEGIPAAAYATKKKKKRNYAGIVLGLGILVVLAGGGYALWANRDALNDMVGGLVNSAQTGNGSSGSTQTASAPANGTTTPAPTQPATNGQQSQTTPPAATPSDDGSVTGTKFTQRLLADGTERDEGAGPGANGQPATAEGQSVYQQNEAPAQTNATTPAPAGQAPAQQTPAATAAAKGDRMFLYEEVLGQTVPTAIEGTVSWSLQSEQDDAGKPSSTVQGQINIPGRGLSALITFKRNTDPSLPASHLVEIVFSVSPGFEGGAIDSVQRIAMKSTEQDRGNALIAVPAKITDDFHMIALNDFPDARKTNLELMRTRDWIDIPVAYRNGRRALLTLQKGADGKAAFDTALREWTAASPADGQ